MRRGAGLSQGYRTMTILIAYATTDGQTRKIARFCADRLAVRHAVELLNLDDAEGLEPSRFTAAILAGSLHMHAFQKALTGFAQTHAVALSTMPTLFLAVSLSAAGDDADDHAGLRACHAAFVAQTGWTPGVTLDVAGAFRFAEYDFFRAWVMKRIAAGKGQPVDGRTNAEYTDWVALAAAVDRWATDLAVAGGLVGAADLGVTKA